jgi:hypothetical protein
MLLFERRGLVEEVLPSLTIAGHFEGRTKEARRIKKNKWRKNGVATHLLFTTMVIHKFLLKYLLILFFVLVLRLMEYGFVQHNHEADLFVFASPATENGQEQVLMPSYMTSSNATNGANQLRLSVTTFLSLSNSARARVARWRDVLVRFCVSTPFLSRRAASRSI